jgi:hypothetical protein
MREREARALPGCERTSFEERGRGASVPRCSGRLHPGRRRHRRRFRGSDLSALGRRFTRALPIGAPRIVPGSMPVAVERKAGLVPSPVRHRCAEAWVDLKSTTWAQGSCKVVRQAL